MSILIDKNTRVLVQGITGREGQFHTERMTRYGTRVVGGVTPGRGGQSTLGVPVFDANAPNLRVQGRKVSNAWAHLETLWAGIGDSLYGFRVYPVAPLRAVMQRQHWMRRFDFDPEAVVRLSWRGVPAVNLPAPVRYLRPEEGGVSHFSYLRDNVLLTWMHTRLFLGFVLRLPLLVWRRVRGTPGVG